MKYFFVVLSALLALGLGAVVLSLHRRACAAEAALAELRASAAASRSADRPIPRPCRPASTPSRSRYIAVAPPSHQTTRSTYRIPPQQNPDCAHEKFSKSVRKNLVKAAALATVSEDGDLQSFYAMQQKTFSRQGLASPYSYAFLEQLDQVLAAHQARKIYLARNQEGILCCASYIVFDDQWVYQLMSGTDPVYRDLQCKTLLVEKALDFAVSTGRGFDFEGSMLQGVEEFNRAFGATQTSYFSIHKTYTKNPLLRAAINQKMQ